jgi:hypothetical protein
VPEWLQDAFHKEDDIALSLMVTRLVISLVLGCVVGGIYHFTRGKHAGQSPGLLATLVLLTVLISIVTLVIGNSVARAFSLVGALAIVRFRTVVEDTRDTAFVIFAVAVGMAVGAGFLKIPLAGIPVAGLAAFLFRPRDPASLKRTLDFTLTVRVGTGHNPDELLREPCSKHLQWKRLTATATARQGVAMDLTYAVRLVGEEAALALVAELNVLEGIQNVELRRE